MISGIPSFGGFNPPFSQPTTAAGSQQATAKGRSRAAKRDQVTLDVLFVWLEFTFFWPKKWLYTMRGPRSIVQLVQITPITMVYGT